MRARNIKQGFFVNEDIAELPYECRLLFIGLWCYADREGRFEWRPKRIKAAIFPYDSRLNIDKILDVITSTDIVIRYSDNGRQFAYIPKFVKHQKPHPHEAKSVIPQPLLNQCHDMSLNVSKCSSDIRKEERGMLIEERGKRKEDISLVTQADVIEIINFLNETLKTSYKPNSKKTKSLINARMAEGFTIDDFKTVILKKHRAWGTDDKMRAFLRPETLFSPKFEGYLNEVENTTGLSSVGVKNAQNVKDWIEETKHEQQ